MLFIAFLTHDVDFDQCLLFLDYGKLQFVEVIGSKTICLQHL